MQTDKKKLLIPSSVMGMLIFAFTEVMFFSALISAYMVLKSTKGFWVPPNEIQLPIVAAWVNTGVLIFSGISVFLAGRSIGVSENAKSHLFRAAISGGFFVVLQGLEWVRLIKYGMTIYSGIFAATFYLLIGSHVLHAVAGVLVLFWAHSKVKNQGFDRQAFVAVEIFWYLIVAVWPILFRLVYF